MTNFLLKLKQQGLYRALASWRIWAAESKSQKQGLRKILHRIERGGLLMAFEAWQQTTAYSKRMWSAASRVVARMQNAAVLSAFGAWVRHSTQCRLVRRVAARMTNKRVSDAFMSWASTVDAAISERESSMAVASLAQLRAEMEAQAAQRDADTMRKVMVRIQHAKLSAALNR